MNAERNSDESIVPSMPANNEAVEASAESVEGRDSAKRNTDQLASARTQSRDRPSISRLDSVREAARRDPLLRITALPHRVSNEALLEAFYDLKRNAAVGVDEMTWHEYEHLWALMTIGWGSLTVGVGHRQQVGGADYLLSFVDFVHPTATISPRT